MADSEYGEVNDILDKIRLFSNLRIRAYEQGVEGTVVHSGRTITVPNGSIRGESNELLIKIKEDLEHWIKNGTQEGESNG